MDTAIRSTNTNIADLCEKYLDYMENVEESAHDTVRTRRSHLKRFSEYFEGDVRHLTNEEINTYFVRLKVYVSPHTKRQLEPGSFNNHKRSVRVFLRWCKEYKELPIKVKVADIKEKHEGDKYRNLLNLNDIDYVISKITVRQDRLMVQLAYEAGLRISELTKVKIEHFRRTNTGGIALEVVGKGKKRRTTFISQELLTDLNEWMYDNGWHTGYVFRSTYHTRKGVYKHLDTVRERIKKWFKKILGIEMVPHDLRHAFARRLLEEGCSIRAIQKLLGHANIQTTMIYLGVDDAWLEKEYMRAIHHNKVASVTA